MHLDLRIFCKSIFSGGYVNVSRWSEETKGGWALESFKLGLLTYYKYWKALREQRKDLNNVDVKVINVYHTADGRKSKTLKESARMDFDFYKLAKYKTLI